MQSSSQWENGQTSSCGHHHKEKMVRPLHAVIIIKWKWSDHFMQSSPRKRKWSCVQVQILTRVVFLSQYPLYLMKWDKLNTSWRSLGSARCWHLNRFVAGSTYSWTSSPGSPESKFTLQCWSRLPIYTNFFSFSTTWQFWVRFGSRGTVHAYTWVRNFRTLNLNEGRLKMSLDVSWSHIRSSVVISTEHRINNRDWLAAVDSFCKRHLNRNNKNNKYQRCCGSGEMCDQSHCYCDN